MKIVDRKTFLAMPPGTVFAKYEPCVFDDLQIKGNSIGDIDYVEQDLTGGAIKCNDSVEWVDLLESAQHRGTSIPMDFYYSGRDGLFDEHQLFAVFERDDVVGLIERLQTALSDMDNA